MPRYLYLDPGIDITGWCVMSDETKPSTLNEALHAIFASGQIATQPSTPLTARLFLLRTDVQALAHEWGADEVIIEEPAYAGDYDHTKKRRQSVNKLYMAIGAMASIQCDTRLLRIIKQSKDERHELLRAVAKKERIEMPKGPRGGAREDEWDAIWLGCQDLL